MKLLFLSSVGPSFTHSEAIVTVFTQLLLECSKVRDVEVCYALDCAPELVDAETVFQLDTLGIKIIGSFAAQKMGKQQSRMATFLGSLLNSDVFETHKFLSPSKVAAIIDSYDFDAALLLWDTSFEFLINHLKTPVVGYLAKPRYESGLTRIEHIIERGGRVFRDRILKYSLLNQQKRHLIRCKQMLAVANIDAVDAREYQRQGIDCKYISNCWPDAFKDVDFKQPLRGSEELKIIGSFSTLYSTGNLIGLDYWAKKVVPELDARSLSFQWKINVYGKGVTELPLDLQRKLKHPRICLNGFVDDIDLALLENHVFLICNNTGPYNGGYTRVAYAMSAGNVVISHVSLKESMPEVVHGENSLLCESPEEFADAIMSLAEDKGLLMRLRRKARATYLENYTPERVAGQLLELAWADR